MQKKPFDKWWRRAVVSFSVDLLTRLRNDEKCFLERNDDGAGIWKSQSREAQQ